MKLQPAKATICNSQRVTYTFAAFALTLYSDKHFSLPEIMSECVLSSMECKLQLLLQTLAASLFLDAERCKEQIMSSLFILCWLWHPQARDAAEQRGLCKNFQFEAGLHQHQIVRVRFQQVVWLRSVGQTETKSWNLSVAELSNNCRKNRPAITLLCRRTLSATVPQIVGRR